MKTKIFDHACGRPQVWLKILVLMFFALGYGVTLTTLCHIYKVTA